MLNIAIRESIEKKQHNILNFDLYVFSGDFDLFIRENSNSNILIIEHPTIYLKGKLSKYTNMKDNQSIGHLLNHNNKQFHFELIKPFSLSFACMHAYAYIDDQLVTH